jgi:2'-5' RNA ligase
MRRLFIALDLDERTRAHVASLAAALKNQFQDAGRISWVQPARLHLTLRFLGDVGDGRVESLVSAMSEPLSARPFAIELGGLGMFPPTGMPRVLWLGLVEGSEQVIALRRQVDERLRGIGIPPEQAAFSPHLTLARFRDRRSRRRLKGSDPLANAGVRPLERCLIDRVTLYESRLSSAGPSYTAVAQALLQP